MTFISAVLGLDWESSAEERSILKLINKTRFSNKKEYYAEFIGYFRLTDMPENMKQLTRKLHDFRELHRTIIQH
ncbi:hypothetical protein ECANGB1_716 [Enterospora canceri]|nr:hypothetical protein ECANGB1_716 [Enterospora canceri]